MAKTLQFRRYNSATIANTTGASGELIVNTDVNTITVHDGSTAGGWQTPTLAYTQAAFAAANTANSSTSYQTGVTAAQNTQIAIIQGVDLGQNASITAINTYAASAYGQANVTVGIDATQNVQIAGIQGVDLAQNTAITLAATIIPQNAQTTNYTLQLSDAGKHLYYTQASNVTLYIPTTSNVAFTNGASIMIVSQTTSKANVTVFPNTGVTLYLAGNTTSASRNVTTYGMATLIQVAANTWYINGTGVA